MTFCGGSDPSNESSEYSVLPWKGPQWRKQLKLLRIERDRPTWGPYVVLAVTRGGFGMYSARRWITGHITRIETNATLLPRRIPISFVFVALECDPYLPLANPFRFSVRSKAKLQQQGYKISYSGVSKPCGTMADSSCSSSSTEHFLGERRTKDIPSQIVWSNENSHIYSELTTTSESNERATILYSYLGPGMTRRQILCAPHSMWWAVGGVLSCRVYYSEIRFSTTISISLDYPLYLLVMWNYVLCRGCSKWVGLGLV